MNYSNDNRIVMTLDAGGTNFVFSAMKGNKEVVDPIRMDSNAHDLSVCLDTLKTGFHQVKDQLSETPVAISFAFPGPADYFNGIIGDLPNLPAFRGGIALGPMLQEEFGMPVYINNDGNLYAFGEALGGYLPHLNKVLKESGSPKQFKNVIGITLGTGFGAGFVLDGHLLGGDNSIGGEVWLLSNLISPVRNIEEGVSARAIVNTYKTLANDDSGQLTPKDIYDIAKGEVSGDKLAAIKSFRQFGLHLGDAIANLITLFDGVVVIGGGLTGAKDLYMPAVMETLKGTFNNGQKRLVQEVFNWDSESERKAFSKSTGVMVEVPFSEQKVMYDSVPKVTIATRDSDASEMIALGAYAYALSQIDVTK